FSVSGQLLIGLHAGLFVVVQLRLNLISYFEYIRTGDVKFITGNGVRLCPHDLLILLLTEALEYWIMSLELLFLEKASVEEGSKKTPCTKAQVDKSKQVCGMIMIWLVLLIPSTIWAQINTLFVKQGTTLNR
ncbi:hypothetical protein KSS87_012041, partial [Heliosperma pusillum]